MEIEFYFVPTAAPAAIVEEIATKAPAVKKANAVRKTTNKKKTVPAPAPAKKTPATVASSTEEINNGNLDFQHTPALLELANSDKKDSLEGADSKPDSSQAINEITGQLLETNKMDEQENQLVDGLDDDETESDNMILITSSDDNKNNNEEYETEVEEEVAADEEGTEATADDEKTANEVIVLSKSNRVEHLKYSRNSFHRMGLSTTPIKTNWCLNRIEKFYSMFSYILRMWLYSYRRF